MIRLTAVELRRLTSRRITLAGVAALLVVTAFMLFASWQQAKPLSAEEQRQNQVYFEEAQKDWKLNGTQYQKDCEASYAAAPDPKPALKEFCPGPPTREQFGKPKTVFAEVMPEGLQGSSYLLLFVAFLVAASFVGAEFSSGSIGNWLTFEPRRMRVYGSKLLAAAIGFVPVAVVITGILLLGTFLIVDQLGTTAGTTSKVWGNLFETSGRIVATTAVGAALGGVVGLLLRHTAAAIGLVMGYIVIIEAVFGGFLAGVQPWLIRLNFDAFVGHGTTYFVDECDGGGGNYTCNMVEKHLSFEHGAWYLSVATVLAIVLGALVFRRRDVN
ncbi:ABC transporter permease subunit [Kribbella sp. CA-293567]|uniref:ABC transporter permease subunit n=1 Tax=Kribbella sp. CA-293567 TaxID=3002436 RepID=UPI0022DE39EE|nr:ABC transporter permease subunit [Kribbella sp. CA-293567]WBQ04520.1 ABC transporter permease subunit [Kribbella sp. CA-293567]